MNYGVKIYMAVITIRSTDAEEGTLAPMYIVYVFGKYPHV